MAQEKLDFNIVSFEIDQFSTTAQDKRYEKIDDDGNRYAIIKVKDVNGEGDLAGFTFNFGSLNSIVETHDDELWVYVQRNAKTVTIKRPGYKTIEKYNLNTTIQSGRVYVMRLTMSHIIITEKRDITKQILQFVVTPSKENAIVKVKKSDSTSDYELWGSVDETGSIDRMVDFGSYDYVVSASNYESSTGRVTLSDSKNTYVEKVVLKPNYGFLVVEDNFGISGAEIFVDDVKIGTIPYRNPDKRWNSGTYRITITNGELYKTYNSTFTIEQGQTTRLSPRLESDFALTTVNVDADAEIFIDGKSKGIRKWTGPLKVGKYVVECKQDRHKSTSISINVKADKAETFEVPAPTAITGSIYVSSTPSGATIKLDGKDIGVTPMLVHDVLIGEHNISLIKQNYKREIVKVTIKEGQTENLSKKLNDIAQMNIESLPNGAELRINGTIVGKTPYNAEMSSGDYNIELHHKKYQTFKETVHLDGSHPTMKIKMQRQFMQPNAFYIQPTIQIGSNMAIGCSIGGYIANVNLEGGYSVGLSGPKVYWNSIDGNEPQQEVLKSSNLSIRIGYGIISGTRLRITPQLGANIVSFKGEISKSNATSAVFGCRTEYALMSGIGVSITPEYALTVKKSNTFQRLLDGGIKDSAAGFNLKFGINVFF